MAKIKQKTKRAVSKRFSVTKSGLLKRKHAYRSHLALGRSTKAKRQLRKDTLVHASDVKRFKQCL
ncbi:50S ribosomal protein L35 [Ureaplasma diversum]|uniref:Large ribosomal subunit protein bL35 n=2 Tax=Ureaplasma diversum TaxID=42094 RepID=A0A084F1D8_9BACT|nr:50S ribosomal protein L35 [Ureaplasma diversum]AJQ45078.1 50S ribosomal protein L35 [Ureaplasma diversum]KEZ24030.1 50S ribosomal protein L35 [Ureaplasma diversum NCTC 246]